MRGTRGTFVGAGLLTLAVFGRTGAGGLEPSGARARVACDVGALGVQTFTSTDVPKSIPDNDTNGVSSSLTIGFVDGVVKDIDASVNVTHPHRGDLRLTLYHPDGTQVILHNQTGGSADNVITTYDTLTQPAQSLSALFGKPINGTWRLLAQDLAAANVGTIEGWSLSIESSAGGGPQTTGRACHGRAEDRP